jgi:branched-subunit amino acid ABC-type transport system permease component
VRVRAWLLFTALRLLAFVGPFALLFALGVEWWIAAVGAAVIGFCVSYIFLRPLRDRVALQLAAARAGTAAPRGDEAAEDADR